MKRLLLGLILCVACAAAFAGTGSATNVTITQFSVYASGKVVIGLSNNTTGGPTCSGGAGAVTVDGSTAGGRVVAAHAEYAYAAGKQISLVGTGSCDSNGYEDINALWSN